MADRVTKFLTLLADRLAAGPLDAVTLLHSYPLPMQVGEGHLQVVWSAAEHQDWLARRRDEMAEAGVRRIVAEIGGIEASKDARCRAWVRWLQLGEGDRVIREVPTVLYLRRFPDGELRVEMMHIVQAPAAEPTPPARLAAAAQATPGAH